MRFAGKRALITGGGTGIGAAVASRMQEGAHVTVMGRRQAPLEAVSPNIVVGDVRNVDDCRRAVEAAGPLDILVHNAGVAGTGWDDVLAVDLRAPTTSAAPRNASCRERAAPSSRSGPPRPWSRAPSTPTTTPPRPGSSC